MRCEEHKKIVFMGHPKYLPMEHWMRGSTLLGLSNDELDLREAPLPRTPLDWFQRWDDVENGKIDIDKSGMKRKSIFYSLPYWKVIKIW